MEIRIDFQLNYRFGVIEKTIFRLVLNGFKDAAEISNSLPIFSDIVIANGIRNLVNSQIITANTDSSILNLSDPIIAIIDITKIRKNIPKIKYKILKDCLVSLFSLFPKISSSFKSASSNASFIIKYLMFFK